MGVEFTHGLWKTVLMHDMRDNIHILKKNGSWVYTKHLQTQKCMAIQKVYLTLPRACLDRHVPLHTECLVGVWSMGSCVLSLLKYFIHQSDAHRHNRSFMGPFQTQLPLRCHFYISSHPFPANVKCFAPHFRILSLTKKKKKNALCSLLSLDQKALLLMKRNLKNHSLFVFPCPVPPSDIFHWGRCLPGILLSLSLSQKLYFFCCFWSMKDVCWVGKSSEIF